MKHCTGHSKQTGKPCGRPPTPGKAVCHFHGSRSPSGSDSQRFLHGRYSKAMPARLASRFEASLNDPELVDLTREIALIDARIEELVGRIDSGESGAIWKALRDAHKELMQARFAEDKQGQADAINKIGGLIQRGFADNAAWVDIFEAIEMRRVAVQTEARRRQAMQDSITSKQAMALVAALIMAVRRHVADPSILRAVSADVMAIVDRDTGGGALAACGE